MKATWTLWAVPALALALAACSKTPTATCGPSNCVGCCDSAGVCQVSDSTHCGVRGAACAACPGGQQCSVGACQAQGTGSSSSGAASSSSSSSGGSSSGSASSSSSGSASGSTSSSSSSGSTGATTSSSSTGFISSASSSSGSTGATTSSSSSGAPGTAVVFPTSVDFRGVALGAPQQRDLTVTNAGAAGTQLLITGIDVVPGANSAASDFTAALAAGSPSPLGPGQSADLVVTATAAAVGAKAATVVIHTNDPATPTWQIPVQVSVQQQPACSYAVSPATLDFGSVEPNVDHQASFTISNTSSNTLETCRISDVDLAWGSAGGAFSVQNAPLDATLAAGASIQVAVTFHPTTAGASYSGEVRFFTSSTTAPQATVHLQGSASTTCLAVSPAALDFGQVQQACSSRPSGVVISNTCSLSVVHLTEIALSNAAGTCPSDAGACPFTLNTASPPYDLAPGASLEANLTYHPTQVGTDSATLTVTAQGYPPAAVAVSGQGTATATQTDTFTPPTSNKVDVLLVVDDSCSMSDKQQALAQNFGAFIQPALDAGVDFHLAVTTTTTLLDNPGNCNGTSGFTSPAPCGLLAPSDASRPQVLTAQTANLATVFGQNVNVGTNGSAVEMGLEGAYEALSSPNLTGANAGFLRADARLAVVVVSDASDQSGRPLDFYLQYFLGLKAGAPNPGFVLSAITSTAANPPSGTCAYDGTNAVPNPYVTLAQQTGGAVEEICSTDWLQMMTDVGAASFGALPTLPRVTLSRAADPAGAFAVSVDGAPLAATRPDGGAAWAFDSTTNAIDFGAPQPASTSTVEVTYDRACTPSPLGSYDAGPGPVPPSPPPGGYSASLLPATYAPLSGGVPVAFSNGDSAITALSLPPGYDFRWYGQPVDTVYVDTNGFVGFDPALLSLCGSGFACDLNNTLPAQAGSPQDAVYLWWADLEVTDGGQVAWGTEDVGGQQVFTVDYQGVSYYGAPGTTSNAKLHLYPASSTVEVVYGAQSSTTSFGSAVVGVQSGPVPPGSWTPGLACATRGCTPVDWPAGQALTYSYQGNALFGPGEFTVGSASASVAPAQSDLYLYDGNDAPGCPATSYSGNVLHLGLTGDATLDGGATFSVDAGTAVVQVQQLFPDGGAANAGAVAGLVQVTGLTGDGGLLGSFSAALPLADGGLGELHGSFYAPTCQ